ncbi:peptidylprolyl isomerase [Sedimentitalea todarodis]|uniref:peptidylprolyl isomerase n=1 Tax=Sedimentitalea todarodis TaxID=1631240 RepID=A0ABU3VKZ3_9RHOB|nr:peptidylprolyl isomerase [Sedimentitalea todarodis]MDU9006861.1 peptidylprolyl isomerase [Sedimentitalea todarodis]
MNRFLTIFREPMMLFSLTAAAVFGLHALSGDDDAHKVIKVSPEAIAGSLSLRQDLIGRQLTADERDEIVEKLVRQEILVQEAAARGLHLHDSKTRERLVTQMYFVMTEDAPEPRPEDLSAFYESNPDRYMLPKTVTFDHVFFETDQTAAQTLMDQINAGGEIPEDAGDTFWLGNRLEHYGPGQLVTVLGWEFGAQIRDLELGVWTGPIRSGRGWHLVRLDAFNPPKALPPEELNRRLREDWTQAYSQRSFEKRLDVMRASYTINLPSTEEVQATKPRLQTVQVLSAGGPTK